MKIYVKGFEALASHCDWFFSVVFIGITNIPKFIPQETKYEITDAYERLTAPGFQTPLDIIFICNKDVLIKKYEKKGCIIGCVTIIYFIPFVFCSLYQGAPH